MFNKANRKDKTHVLFYKKTSEPSLQLGEGSSRITEHRKLYSLPTEPCPDNGDASCPAHHAFVEGDVLLRKNNSISCSAVLCLRCGVTVKEDLSHNVKNSGFGLSQIISITSSKESNLSGFLILYI